MDNRAYKHLNPNDMNSALVGANMDQMKYYYYTASGLTYDPVVQPVPTDATNQLAYITDNIGDADYLPEMDADDIDNQLSNNYTYDQIGQLKSDAAEHIQEIKWNAINKVKEVIYNGPMAGTRLLFDYDGNGHRCNISENPSENSFFLI